MESVSLDFTGIKIPKNHVEEKEEKKHMSKVGIVSAGAYIPYYYIERNTIAKSWKKRGLKGIRSMANDDEDTVTMAVEAVRQSLERVDKDSVTGVIFASTSAPYGEKSHAGIIAAACDLPRRLFTADYASSLKGGTSAMKAAADAAFINSDEKIIVVASDSRNARPNSPKEQLLGDAAASVVIGAEGVLASIDEFVSVSDEIVDVWRNSDESFVNWGEGRFIGDEGYMKSLACVIEELLKKTQMKPSDFAKVILPTSDLKEYVKLAKKMGFLPEQIQDPLMLEVGDCGTAQVLLMLTAALENAKPGDRILLANYANGADALLLTVTEEIGRIKGRNTVDKLVQNRREFQEYSRFLSYKGLCPIEESVYNLKPSNSQTWREQATFIKLQGSKCRNCGTEIFPISKVCPECGATEDYELVALNNRKAKIYTFTLDELAGSVDDPVVGQICANDDQGVRYYNNLTDFEPGEVEVGMKLEFTFRKMNELGNFNNYYWKLRPVRIKEDDGCEG